MDVMPFQVVLLVSFPEAMLVAALGFRLLGIALRWPHLVAIGVLQALTAWGIRALPVPFGVHTVVLAAAFTLIIWRVARVPYRVAAIGGLLGLTIYMVIEFLSVSSLFRIMGLSLPAVWAGGWTLRVLLFLPQALVVLLLIVLVSVFRLRLIDLGRGGYYR